MSQKISCISNIPIEVFLEAYSYLGARDVGSHAMLSCVSKATRAVMTSERIIKYHMMTLLPKEYKECISEGLPQSELHYAYRINARLTKAEGKCALIETMQDALERTIMGDRMLTQMENQACEGIIWVGATVATISTVFSLIIKHC